MKAEYHQVFERITFNFVYGRKKNFTTARSLDMRFFLLMRLVSHKNDRKEGESLTEHEREWQYTVYRVIAR